jgi:cell wall assembly regulator SMI1
VIELWKRLESHLKRHAPPEVLHTLNTPATARQIRNAEKQIGMTFPDELVESLLVHNGQVAVDVPLVPEEYEKGRGSWIATVGILMDLDTIVGNTKFYQQVDRATMRREAAHGENRGPLRRDGNWSWIVYVNSDGDVLALDLNPAPGGSVGQVVSRTLGALTVLAPSYRAWFEQLVERYESGRYTFIDLQPVDVIGPVYRNYKRKKKGSRG